MPNAGDTKVVDGRTKYYTESASSPGTFYWSSKKPEGSRIPGSDFNVTSETSVNYTASPRSVTFTNPDGTTHRISGHNNIQEVLGQMQRSKDSVLSNLQTQAIGTFRTNQQLAEQGRQQTGSTQAQPTDQLAPPPAPPPPRTTQTDAPYGLNPRTNEPLSLTQAYNLARQANAGLSFSQFQANPTPFLETAGINMREVEPRTGEGTIQQQNQTGMSFLQWKESNPTGTYNDWLNAPAGAPTGAAPPSAPGFDADKAMSDAMSVIDQSNLPDDQKALFKSVVRNWDIGQELNMQNVLDEFKKVKAETIDPHFKQQSDLFINSLQSNIGFQAQQREAELETERTMAGRNIRQAREGLEKAGMTFTGKGIETLGAEAAIGQQPTAGVPGQTPFGGLFHEGTVQQANRLMASGSAARYQRNLELLGQQAERTLGTQQALGQIPGFQAAGGITGALPESQKQAEAQTLSGLAGQQRQNRSFQQPVSTFQFN
jgi:hypothetical protein